MSKLVHFLFMAILICNCAGADAQLRRIEKGMHPKLAKALKLEKIPADATFKTVQVASVNLDYLKYDPDLSFALSLFRPVYVDLNYGTLYVGCFENVMDAKTFCRRVQCIFPSCFVVTRVPSAGMGGKQLPERSPSIPAALEKLDGLIHTGYYRLQIGYYEQPGFTPDEQKTLDKLVAANVRLIEEKYKKGRLLLTEQTFVTLDEAIVVRDQLEEILGREVLFKPYQKPEGVDIGFAERAYFCLRKE